MTEQLKIQVSAYIDDELLDEECELLVRRMCADDSLMETVRRYSLIGDVLRGDDIAARVALAEQISRQLEEHEELGVPQPAQATGGTSRLQRFIRPLAGVAVAATVATVAVISVQGPVNPLDGELPSTTTAYVDNADGSSSLGPIDVSRFINTPGARPASAVPPSRMDKYLIRHRSYASGFGGQSIMGLRDVSNYGVVPGGVSSTQAAAPGVVSAPGKDADAAAESGINNKERKK